MDFAFGRETVEKRFSEVGKAERMAVDYEAREEIVNCYGGLLIKVSVTTTGLDCRAITCVLCGVQ